MKRILVAALAVMVSVSAFAQGTVFFSNFNPGAGIDAKVTFEDGVTGVAAGFTGELALVGAGGVLTPVATSPFRTDFAAAAGYIGDSNITVPGVAGGASATFVMRAYDGANYDSSTMFGSSAPFTITLGGAGEPPSLPADLVGLQAFSVVPEPSTIALGVLGVLGLVAVRRRK